MHPDAGDIAKRVYLNTFEHLRDAAAQTGNWMKYYNRERPHSSLKDFTPGEVFRGISDVLLAA
jgi:transposase InsO family protein